MCVEKKNAKVRYFTSKLTDGKKMIHLTSSESKLRAKIERLTKEKKPVAIINCAVKETR